MRILCAKSGIEFTAEHFAGSLYAREYSHPVFHLGQRKLLPYASKYFAGEMNSIDSYLLFLALLDSTDKIVWSSPAKYCGPLTDAIIANHMENLFRLVGAINVIVAPAFSNTVCSLHITPETANLANIHLVLESWTQSLEDFNTGYRSRSEDEKLQRRQAALEYLIKDPGRKPESYSRILAEWAEQAANFPRFMITLPSGINIRINEYWKGIISKCARGEAIFAIPQKDIAELIEHCEDNVLNGSIYSHALFALLREGKNAMESLLGFGVRETRSNGGFQIIPEDSKKEEELKAAMIASAPKTEPNPLNYARRIDYIRDKMRWEMAQGSSKNISIEEAL